jgi:hypothetical protein
MGHSHAYCIQKIVTNGAYSGQLFGMVGAGDHFIENMHPVPKKCSNMHQLACAYVHQS